MPDHCRVCGHPDIHAKDRCKTDYQYRRRTGTDRPEELIVRHGRRIMTRRLASRYIS